MSNPAQIRYAARASNGIYDSLLEQVDEGGDAYLANCVYGRQFMRKTRWKDGFDFQTNTGDEFRTCVFGEIQRSAMGTKHSAVGSHFVGKGTPNYITDDTKVKNLFMLGMPTSCSAELRDRFNDQFVAINEIVEADAKEDLASNKSYTNKEAVIRANTDFMFAITSPPKYIVPRIAPDRVPAVRLMKRSRDNSTPAESPTAGNETGSSSKSDANKNDQREIKVGNTYDPSVLTDYGGPLFRHVYSQLVQHDISTLDKRMIPPWEEYEALTEGTLVIFTISIHTFIMPIKDNQGHYTGDERRVYQLNMHSILIIDESDSATEPRYKPYTNEETVASTASVPVSTAADRALATFKVKKPRHDSPTATRDVEETKTDQTKVTPSGKAIGNSNKPAAKPAAAPKPTKRVANQRATAKGKEKASVTPLSASTSGTADTDDMADEDQVMEGVEDA